MELRNWEDFVAVDADGKIVAVDGQLNLDAFATIDASGLGSAVETHTAGTIGGVDDTITGTLGTSEGIDQIAIDLTAGVTYSFALTGLIDPFLFLYGTDKKLLAYDDDGGLGRSSMITFTPTTTGTYYIGASSWYHVDNTAPGYPTADSGDYAINIWTKNAATDVGGTVATALTVDEGIVYGYVDSATDADVYRVEVQEGMAYVFNYSGGVTGNADYGIAGGSIAYIDLLNSSGAVIATNVNFESGLSYFAQSDGEIFVRVRSYSGTTGGYQLDVDEVDPATRDPLNAIRWKNADNIDTVDENGDAPGGHVAYVYFGAAGENFGEAVVNMGWTDWQKAGVMAALSEFTPITGIEYRITTDVTQAEFRMITVASATYGARFYPQDPAYGTQQGIGTFNLASGGFGTRPESLQRGGFSYAVVMHEFGHAHGLAHPHDTGGGSEVMLGVTAATGSYGVYNLNQGVYTVMSYNDAWDFHPDGGSRNPATGGVGLVIDRGWSATLGAFDIAALQERYGVHAYNTGDDVYTLTDNYLQAKYQTIWDTGGVDTIAYGGSLDAQIDLLAATLDYSPTGGGVVSFLYNTPQPDFTTEIKGGFTIAHGVEIENATGGGGNDALLGNALANTLTGNGGNDTLMGREGNDLLIGGQGSDTIDGGDGVDTVSYAGSALKVNVNLTTGTATGEGADTLTSVENVIGSNYNDRIIGDANANRIAGGLGIDVVTLGGGADVFVAEQGAKVSTKTGSWSWDIVTDFGAGDKIDLSAFSADNPHFIGTNANKNTGDVSYKLYDSISGAEKALGIDIDGQPGGNVAGPVTVVYVNHDGGSPDVGIILLNHNGVSANDFILHG